jgi:hypothetical protein
MSPDDVVGDHAHAHVVVVILAVFAAPRGRMRRRGTGRTWSISYMLSTPCLRNATRSMPHAGVDVLLRQLADDAELGLRLHVGEQVLHEDEVPDLEVPVSSTAGPPSGRTRAAVEVDLRARAAGPGCPVCQ